MSTPATVTPVRPSAGDVLLSPKADAAAPSSSCLYEYLCIIYELHLKIKKADAKSAFSLLLKTGLIVELRDKRLS